VVRLRVELLLLHLLWVLIIVLLLLLLAHLKLLLLTLLVAHSGEELWELLNWLLISSLVLLRVYHLLAAVVPVWGLIVPMELLLLVEVLEPGPVALHIEFLGHRVHLSHWNELLRFHIHLRGLFPLVLLSGLFRLLLTPLLRLPLFCLFGLLFRLFCRFLLTVLDNRLNQRG
jgi:hypothetical protein